MKAEPGDVVREKLSGNGLIGRVITIDPARKWANIRLRDTVQIFAENDYDVVFRRGVREEDEPAPRKSPRTKPAVVVVVDQVSEASTELTAPAEAAPVLQ